MNVRHTPHWKTVHLIAYRSGAYRSNGSQLAAFYENWVWQAHTKNRESNTNRVQERVDVCVPFEWSPLSLCWWCFCCRSSSSSGFSQHEKHSSVLFFFSLFLFFLYFSLLLLNISVCFLFSFFIYWLSPSCLLCVFSSNSQQWFSCFSRLLRWIYAQPKTTNPIRLYGCVQQQDTYMTV